MRARRPEPFPLGVWLVTTIFLEKKPLGLSYLYSTNLVLSSISRIVDTLTGREALGDVSKPMSSFQMLLPKNEGLYGVSVK